MIIHNAKNCKINNNEDKQLKKNGITFILIIILTIVAYACILNPIYTANEKKYTGTDNKTETQFKVILRDKYIDDDFIQSVNTKSWNSCEFYDSDMKSHKIIWKEIK